MASADCKDTQSCLSDPNFAVICAFLQKFSLQLNVQHPNFHDLQKMIEDTDEGKWKQFNINSEKWPMYDVLYFVYIHRFHIKIKNVSSAMMHNIIYKICLLKIKLFI